MGAVGAMEVLQEAREVVQGDRAGMGEAERVQHVLQADPAQYDKMIEASRRASADYTRDYAQYDEETIAAVDKFRADRGQNYQGNPAGLVDARMIESLRAAYLEKKKGAGKR